VTKNNYFRMTNTQLFSHNTMQEESRRLDPYDANSGTGILGRMTDVLTQNGHSIGSFSIGRSSVANTGKPNKSGAPAVVDQRGISRFHLNPDVKNRLSKLHNKTELGSGIFADTWSASFMDAITGSERSNSALESVKTKTKFPETGLGNSFKTIARLIATRNIRGVDVDTFHVQANRFDTHSDLEHSLKYLFKDVNRALDAFVNEMKSINEWNNTVLIQTSDFARTLNPNGNNGTDHAWGGNYMLMGGSVKGRQILGEYPTDFTTNGPLTLHRGRMIPSTPWEAPFRGIASWLGIGTGDMLEVCPNLPNFDSTYLIDPERIFHGIQKPPPTPEVPKFPLSGASSCPSGVFALSLSLVVTLSLLLR